MMFAPAPRLAPALALMLLVSASALAGCASVGPALAPRQEAVPYPAWVKQGTALGGADGQDKAFYGLGEVRGIRNVALARATADNRARAELARLLDAFVAQWLGNCPMPPGQTSEALMRLLTASSLSGVQIVEHYFHPDDGSVFSLARLDLSHVVQHLQLGADIPTPVKKYLMDHSDEAFGRMARNKQT